MVRRPPGSARRALEGAAARPAAGDVAACPLRGGAPRTPRSLHSAMGVGGAWRLKHRPRPDRRWQWIGLQEEVNQVGIVAVASGWVAAHTRQEQPALDTVLG